jgi:hypothetical protein
MRCALAAAFAQHPPHLAAGPWAEVPDSTEFVQEEWLSWRLPGWTFLPGDDDRRDLRLERRARRRPGGDGRTDSDSLFLVQPFGRVEYHSPRTIFTSGYRGYLRRYTEASQLNGFDQRLSASVRRRATRFVTLVRHEPVPRRAEHRRGRAERRPVLAHGHARQHVLRWRHRPPLAFRRRTAQIREHLGAFDPSAAPRPS